MQPFDSIKFVRFRGISGLVLDGLGPVNVLVGSNNSGKTSVLEGVALVCRPTDITNWLGVATDRDPSMRRLPPAQRVGWLFPCATGRPGEEGDSELRIEVTGGYAVRLLAATRSPMALVPDLSPSTDDDAELPPTIEATELRIAVSSVMGGLFADELHTVSATEVLPGTDVGPSLMRRVYGRPTRDAPGLPVASVSPYTHRVEPLHVRELFAAKERREHGLLVELLAAFDADIEDLDVEAPDGRNAVVFARHRTRGMMPIGAFGDGMRRALVMALGVYRARGGVLLLDEIESSIHYTALEDTFRWLVSVCRSAGVQLLATTHSLEAVDAMIAATRDVPDDLVVVRLAGPSARRLDGGLAQRLRDERGLELR